MKYLKNQMYHHSKQVLMINISDMQKAYLFHQTMPKYQKTPYYTLDSLANYLGISQIGNKDESQRFHLNAFKILGASYAMAHEFVQEDVTYQNVLASLKHKDIHFYSATDGNHGRAVAHMAKLLGQKADIYMPKGTTDIRLGHIHGEGAQGQILDCNYDECVRYAFLQSQKHHGVLIQDTTFDGYQDIPLKIMQGYTTIVMELKEQKLEVPTHVFYRQE